MNGKKGHFVLCKCFPNLAIKCFTLMQTKVTFLEKLIVPTQRKRILLIKHFALNPYPADQKF